MTNDWHNPAHWRIGCRSLPALSFMMVLAGCGDDAGSSLGSQQGAVNCSDLSVAAHADATRRLDEANGALMREAAGPMAGMNIPGMPKLF